MTEEEEHDKAELKRVRKIKNTEMILLLTIVMAVLVGIFGYLLLKTTSTTDNGDKEITTTTSSAVSKPAASAVAVPVTEAKSSPDSDIFSFDDLSKGWLIGGVIGGVIVLVLCLSLYVSKKQETDSVTSNSNSTFYRLMIFVVFNIVLAGFLYWFANRYLFTVTGTDGIFAFLIRIICVGVMTYSVYQSWDSQTVKLNEAGEILYFEKNFFSNVKSGIICLGLPTFLGSKLVTVSFKKTNITVGLMKNGVREPFVVECNGFRAIFDIAFEVSPCDTRTFLQLSGSIEKRLVIEVNAVLYAIANSCIMENDLPKIDADGKETKRFPAIEDLKRSTRQITEEMLMDSTEHGIKARLKKLGHTLHSITLKDVENEDRQIITATQAAAAQVFLEQAEMTSLKNTSDKAHVLWLSLNMIGKENELPEKDRVSMKTCLETVERAEKNRQTIDITGGGRSIIVPPLSTSKP